MRKLLKNYLPAVACALTLILCYFVVRPYAEIGIADDWVYARDALNVALTGHISYSGGETPMLGWQLYFGALFIKLFGFSFTAVRFSTAVLAIGTAFLLQRIGMRAGLNSWNAALATLIFVLSPLYFPYAFTFMSDVSGVLCILVCVLHVFARRAVQERACRNGLGQPCRTGERFGRNGAADCMAGLAGHGSVHALAAQEELARARGRRLVVRCRAGFYSCGVALAKAAALHPPCIANSPQN